MFGAVSLHFLSSCFEGRKLPGHSRLLLADWSEEDVQAWLCDEGLQELVSIFKSHNMDGPELNKLNKETAAELGIGEDEMENKVTNIGVCYTHTLVSVFSCRFTV